MEIPEVTLNQHTFQKFPRLRRCCKFLFRAKPGDGHISQFSCPRDRIGGSRSLAESWVWAEVSVQTSRLCLLLGLAEAQGQLMALVFTWPWPPYSTVPTSVPCLSPCLLGFLCFVFAFKFIFIVSNPAFLDVYSGRVVGHKGRRSPLRGILTASCVHSRPCFSRGLGGTVLDAAQGPPRGRKRPTCPAFSSEDRVDGQGGMVEEY